MKNVDEKDEELPSAEDLAAAEKMFEEEAKNAEFLRNLSKEERQEVILHLARSQSSFRELDESPWLKALREAHACEALQDWVGAEAGYHKAIAVSADEPGLEFKAYEHLSSFLKLLGRNEEALAAAHTASVQSRTCDMEMVVPTVLIREAALQLSVGDQRTAQDLIEEAVQILDGLDQVPIINLLRSRVLLARSNYHLELGELSEADSNLKSVEPLLDLNQEFSGMEGFQAAIGRYWSIKARLSEKTGDKEGALAALDKAVLRSRAVAAAPHIEGLDKHNSLAWDLSLLGRAQEEAGDPQAAESLKESAELRRWMGFEPFKQ